MASFISLPSKPDAPLSYTLTDSQSNLLVVFINGLGLPAASWGPVITSIQSSTVTTNKPKFLSYDRFGQGKTESRDPADRMPGKEDGYGHDLSDVVDDLDELIRVVAPEASHLIFVSASIGVNIARLYDSKFPGRVSAYLMLDSNMANLGLDDVFPDPDGPAFDPSAVVGDDCSLDAYRGALQRASIVFNPATKNAEGLDRRSTRTLLPSAQSPALSHCAGRAPWLTVVGHDPASFEEESAAMMKIPPSITRKYSQPAWDKYNADLLKLGTTGRTTGVLYAPGCGHFIQKDNPDFVAEQLLSLLGKVEGDVALLE